MRFLACTDGSAFAEKAIKASAIAAVNAGFGLILLNVIEDVVRYEKLPEDPGFKIRMDKANKILLAGKEIVTGVNKDIACTFKIAHGPVASEIVRVAVTEEVASIFLGTKGNKSIPRKLLGSVADDVIRHAPCPVTVVR
jgi:nucleotide-binding universal stress UspA family protein